MRRSDSCRYRSGLVRTSDRGGEVPPPARGRCGPANSRQTTHCGGRTDADGGPVWRDRRLGKHGIQRE